MTLEREKPGNTMWVSSIFLHLLEAFVVVQRF